MIFISNFVCLNFLSSLNPTSVVYIPAESPYLSSILATHNCHLLSNCSFLLCIINTKGGSTLDVFIL